VKPMPESAQRLGGHGGCALTRWLAPPAGCACEPCSDLRHSRLCHAPSASHGRRSGLLRTGLLSARLSAVKSKLRVDPYTQGREAAAPL